MFIHPSSLFTNLVQLSSNRIVFYPWIFCFVSFLLFVLLKLSLLTKIVSVFRQKFFLSCRDYLSIIGKTERGIFILWFLFLYFDSYLLKIVIANQFYILERKTLYYFLGFFSRRGMSLHSRCALSFNILSINFCSFNHVQSLLLLFQLFLLLPFVFADDKSMKFSFL